MTKIILNNGRTKCEIFSRIVGYVRRIDAWNPKKAKLFWAQKNLQFFLCYGKQAEFKDRKLFKIEK